jgi:hypothetical protein
MIGSIWAVHTVKTSLKTSSPKKALCGTARKGFGEEEMYTERLDR